MKKLFMLMLVGILGIGTMLANPVDANTAKTLGQKYVLANFEQTRGANLELVYTVTSENGEPCAYVFNVDNYGFIVVAASDNVRPVLAYSEENVFDTNPEHGAMFMLDTYKKSISYAIERNIAATFEIENEWKSLDKFGKLSDKKAEKVGPIVQTKWNQNSPYNYYAPAASGGPGGRCYAGCVATAMSQIMKVWNHPIHGTGSHSYTSSTYHYNLSANFGNTTYAWDNMPVTLSGATQTQIEAVARLMYHCGVAVDMDFDPEGSGSNSQKAAAAMRQYFDYNYAEYRAKGSTALTVWNQLLRDEFDLGRPVLYAGTEPGSPYGHAFVCDGYDHDDLMHFNFGWSGSGDGWFVVDAIDYTTDVSIVQKYVPTQVYQNTAQAPSNLTIVKESNTVLEATISWKNPSKTVGNQNLSSIDQIVVKRNDKVIYTVDNPTPGANMSFVDANVPCYSAFEYEVYAVKNGARGVGAKATEQFGPTCNWSVVVTASDLQGWRDGRLVAYDGAGAERVSVTMTNNQSTSIPIAVNIGKVSFVWKSGSQNVTLSFKIKNSSGTVLYQYSGASDNIPSGVLYTCNNNCNNAEPTEAPTNLHAVKDGDNIVLSWDGNAKPNYGYNIYRDDVLCGLAESNEFVDSAPTIGGHCYRVCVLTEGGESPLSNEACANVGEGCEAGKHLWYTLQNNGKPTLTWEKPNNTEGLSYFIVYRKVNDGEYEQIKLVQSNKTEYKETKAMTDGNWYSYKVVAYYSDIDCYSAPFKALYGYEFFVKVYYSVDGVDEAMAQIVSIYPNPSKDVLTVEAESISNIAMYNTLGQKVFAQDINSDKAVINVSDFETGLYMIRIVANGSEITRKISIVR